MKVTFEVQGLDVWYNGVFDVRTESQKIIDNRRDAKLLNKINNKVCDKIVDLICMPSKGMEIHLTSFTSYFKFTKLENIVLDEACLIVDSFLIYESHIRIFLTPSTD